MNSFEVEFALSWNQGRTPTSAPKPLTEWKLKAVECKPDLVILDHFMPVLDGLSAASKIREVMPEVPILMLSMHDGSPLINALRLIGAKGFVPKAECADRLNEGIDAVMRGETFFGQERSSGSSLFQ
jgi:DNA-binding NarL/FixJ family response regulator